MGYSDFFINFGVFSEFFGPIFTGSYARAFEICIFIEIFRFFLIFFYIYIGISADFGKTLKF